jgi:putative Mn2+ efflux pump MntP
MYRFFFRFVVTTLTILTANLLTNAISDYMVSYKNHYKPVIFTFIGMAIIIVGFLPAFYETGRLGKRFFCEGYQIGELSCR